MEIIHNEYKSQTSLVLDFQNAQVKPANPLPIRQLGSSQGTSRKRMRKSNFTYKEDLMLVSAWLNVSLNLTPGTRQKHQTYWERVHAYFQEHKQFTSDRTPSSLMHRWSVIQIAVSKFEEYLNQIESRSESGLTEEDKICQALEMYKNFQKTSFTFIHCWNELRQSPKFCSAILKKKSRISKSPSLSSPATPDSMGMEDNGNNNERDIEPPIEREVTKECSRTTKEMFADVEDDAKVTLVNMKEPEEQQKHEGKTLAADFLKIEMDREKRERRKEEREQILFEQKVLAADMSSMNQYEVEYYISLKEAIVKKRRNLGFDF